MKYLIPLDGSQASLAAIDHLEALARRGGNVEAVLLNVQPLFHRHIANFSRKSDRDALRAERSREALAGAVERLERAQIAFRTVAETGSAADRIAAVAQAHRVDEILMGTGRHQAWLRWLNPSLAQDVLARTDIPVTVLARGAQGALERYAFPAGVAGLAALLIAAD